MPLAKESVWSKYFYQVSFALIGGAGAAFANYLSKKPIHSGIHKHIFFAIIGYTIGHYGNQALERKWDERDAIVRHYIELHPEDFVETKRKYKEMFEPWPPIR